MTVLKTRAEVTEPSCWERPDVPSPCVEQRGALLRGDAGAGGERRREARARGWWMLTLAEGLFSLLMCRERRHSQCICGIGKVWLCRTCR